MNVFWKCGVPVWYFNHANLLLLLVVDDSDSCSGRVNDQILAISVVALHTGYCTLSGVIEDYILCTVVFCMRSWGVREILVVVNELALGVSNEKLDDLCVSMDKGYKAERETGQLHSSYWLGRTCWRIILLSFNVKILKFL